MKEDTDEKFHKHDKTLICQCTVNDGDLMLWAFSGDMSECGVIPYIDT